MNQWVDCSHLSDIELHQIESLQKVGLFQCEIAKQIWCNSSAISRLFKPYKELWQPFNAELEIQRRKDCRNEANQQHHIILKWSVSEVIILSKIKEYRSPEQIAYWYFKCRLWRNISHQVIYDFIYEYYPELISTYFRRKWKKYRHDRWPAKHIPNRVWIEHRPEVANNRARLWDLEWDTICGKGHKQRALTYVCRMSRYLFSKKVKNMVWLAWEVVITTRELLSHLPRDKIHTITDDNWVEFISHEEITRQLQIDIFFADKYSPRQRWTNENTNWLLRQFYPKWFDFTTISDEEFAKTVELINNRPRKTLKRKTPAQIFWNEPSIVNEIAIWIRM